MASLRTIKRWIVLPIALAASVSLATAIYGFALVEHPFSAYRLSLPALAATFAVCAAATAIHGIVRWFRWYFLMRRFSHALPTRLSLQVFFATLLAFLTPFNVGELIRVVPLRNRYATTAQIVWVWIIERWFDTAAIVAMLAYPRSALAAGLVLAAAALVGLAAERWLPKRGSPGLSVSFVGIVTLLSVATWIVPAAALAFILHRLGQDAPFVPVAGVFANSTLWGGIAATPGGAMVAAPLMAMGLYELKIDRGIAVIATTLFRVGTIWLASLSGLIFLAAWGKDLLLRGKEGEPGDHFDSIADEYLSMIPDHVRERLLRRKIQAMRGELRRLGIDEGARGLDVGCGQGLYLCELAQAGYRMAGIDPSQGQVANATRRNRELGLDSDIRHASATALPFDDATFDFAYLINVVHHIPGDDARAQALSEVMRVLRPGGILFLHEMNTRNPIFRFYMGYIFPVLRKIDDGTEEWILPTALPQMPGRTWDPKVHYFTFLPEFIPPWLFRLFSNLERRLENSRLRCYSAHFMAQVINVPSSGVRRDRQG